MARGTWGGTLDPNIFKVNVRFTLSGSKCQWGFKLRDVGIQDNTEQEVADQVRSVVETPFRNSIATQDTFDGVDAQILGQDTGAYANPVGTAGTNPITDSQKIPSFMAVNVALKSEIRKKYGQGRFFLPVRHEGAIDGDTLNATGQAVINDIINALTTNFQGDPVTHDLLLVNAHGVLPPRPATQTRPARPEIPASWYDVVSLRINTVVTALHSRKSGVGS